MSAFLPQNDPNRADRDAALESARRKYAFNYTHVSPLALADSVPRVDEFSYSWLKVMGERVLTTIENEAELTRTGRLADFLRSKHSWLSTLIADGFELLGGLKALVSDAIKFTGRHDAAADRPKSLDDYARLFRKIGLPPIARDYADDAAFAAMRVAGPNPVVLRAVDRLDDRFPLTDELFQDALPGDTLAAAAAEGRLFLADYHLLANAECGDYPDGRKYLYAPLAAFALDRATRRLRPVAIQCKQTPGPENPVFTPRDGYNWLIAKTIVEIADGNLHEAVTHLGLTHLLVEPFVVSTHRQLAPNHPLFLLLAPHFEGTLAINEASWRHLIADKGAVDKLLGGTINYSRGLTAHGLQAFSFAHSSLPVALADRGVADADRFPEYPYRDDGLLHWEAIRDWVREYVALYYPADADVAADTELQAWGAEIGAATGGRINGVGRCGAVAEVVEALTRVIFTCSVQHAAVNFPQYDLMSYAPNMPLAGYAPAPTSRGGATEQDYLNVLPPLDMAELQMELGYALGTVHYTQLGEYAADHFRDPRVAEPLARFRARLADIGTTIAARNAGRRPYEYLLPTGVPQSINV